MLIGSVENLLQEVTVRGKSDTGSIGHVGGQVEDGISVVMLAHLHKVLGASVGKEIDPFLGVKDGCCEILNEIIVHHIRAVGVEMVLPGLVRCSRSIVERPPIPFCVRFWKVSV